MTQAQIQESNREDLLTSRMHSVSHLPASNFYRRCVEREANEAYRNGILCHDAAYVDKEAYTINCSGYVMVGDYLRIQDSFFRIDKVSESAGGTVLDLDDLEGGAFCVVLAGTEI